MPAPCRAVRWGMPWWIGAGSPLEGIEQAAELGFDFVEVSLDAPWPQGLSGPELRDASASAGVGLGFHGPWRTQSIAHPRGTLARAAGTVAKECLNFALGAGAEYIVFHVDASQFAGYPVPEAVDRGLDQARTTLKELAQTAGREFTVLVENTSSPVGTPGELQRFLQELPYVGFCLDPGHAALTEGYDVEGASSDPAAWVEEVGTRLALVHAMDHARVDGHVVDHLVPGAGASDLEALMAATRDAGCQRVLIEAFHRDLEGTPAGPQDLQEARKVLEGL